MTDKDWMRQPMIEGEVRRIARQHHPHLDGLTIAVIGRPQAAKSKGKVVLAKTSVPSEATGALIQDAMGVVHYVIEVGLDAWAALTPAQRTACLDHELCHCLGVDEESGRPKLVGHDAEEFGQVIRRHGLWRPDLESFAEAVASQLERQLIRMGATGDPLGAEARGGRP